MSLVKRPTVALPLAVMVVVASIAAAAALRTSDDKVAMDAVQSAAADIRAIQAAAADIAVARLSADVLIASYDRPALVPPMSLEAAAELALEGGRKLREHESSESIAPYRAAMLAWAVQVSDALAVLRTDPESQSNLVAWSEVDSAPDAFTVDLSEAQASDAADAALKALIDTLAAAKVALAENDTTGLWRAVARIDVQTVWLQGLLRSEDLSVVPGSVGYHRGPGLARPASAPLARCFRGTSTQYQQSCRYAYGALLEWADQARDAASRAAQGDPAGKSDLDRKLPPSPPSPPPPDASASPTAYQERIAKCLKAGGTWVGTPLLSGEYCQIRGTARFMMNPLGALADGAVGAGYSATAALAASGGTPPYRFYPDPTRRTLPLGLLVRDDGTIYGTPTVAEPAREISICATDRLGVEACTSGVLEIAGPAPLVFEPGQDLPAGTVGKPYSGTLCQPSAAATAETCGSRDGGTTNPRGGVPPYIFSGPSAWFTVSPNGMISGTPPAATASDEIYRICVRDAIGQSECGALRVTVAAAPVAAAPRPSVMLAVTSKTCGMLQHPIFSYPRWTCHVTGTANGPIGTRVSAVDPSASVVTGCGVWRLDYTVCVREGKHPETTTWTLENGDFQDQTRAATGTVQAFLNQSRVATASWSREIERAPAPRQAPIAAAPPVAVTPAPATPPAAAAPASTPPTVAAPPADTRVTPALTVTSVSCAPSSRDENGAQYYDCRISGTATGNVYTFLSLPGYRSGSCASWTFDENSCNRKPGEPATTTWTWTAKNCAPWLNPRFGNDLRERGAVIIEAPRWNCGP